MADSRTQFIVDQVKALPIEEQLRVAEAIDRLTWTQRWREICERIARDVATVGEMDDDQIDAEVQEVRRETPLSERSSRVVMPCTPPPMEPNIADRIFRASVVGSGLK
jgi:hypothetical protein